MTENSRGSDRRKVRAVPTDRAPPASTTTDRAVGRPVVLLPGELGRSLSWHIGPRLVGRSSTAGGSDARSSTRWAVALGSVGRSRA